MGCIFKTSSLEFPPLSIYIKEDVLTDNKPSFFKDFMFWGLTIPDSAKQGYVSDLFLHKQLEAFANWHSILYIWMENMIMSRVRIVYKLKEFPIDLYLASQSVKLEDTWRVREMLLSLLNSANVFISHVLTKLRLGFVSWLVTVDLFAIFARIH